MLFVLVGSVGLEDPLNFVRHDAIVFLFKTIQLLVVEIDQLNELVELVVFLLLEDSPEAFVICVRDLFFERLDDEHIEAELQLDHEVVVDAEDPANTLELYVFEFAESGDRFVYGVIGIDEVILLGIVLF